MRHLRSTLLAASLALGNMTLGSLTAFADDVALPGSAATAAPVQTPARGMTMSKVESAFGAPAQREAAVGKPPITRWEYPSFVVYFENEHVIHAVVR